MRKALHILIYALILSCGTVPARNTAVPTQSLAADGRFLSERPFHSVLLGKDLPYAIVLPVDYETETDRSYPVIYLTHGLGCTPDDWNDKYIRFEETLAQLESDGLGDFIYVFPTGFNSYYSNTYDGTFPYMDMFIEEFVPFIDNTYRTIPDREHRATVGFSMGGFGAMILPLKHPETFSISVPLSMSFRTDGQYLAEPLKWWNGQWGFIFGGVDKEGEERLTDYYKAHCPFYQFTAENHDDLSQIKWFLHCGDDEEQLLIANDDLHVQMRDNGYEHEYRVEDGAHTGTYWRKALLETLPYIESMMNGDKRWDRNLTEARPEEIRLQKDGAFVSNGRISSEDSAGTAVFFVYKDLDKETVKDIISILQRGNRVKPFVILPCDISKKPLAKWMSSWQRKYPCEDAQAVAVGEAGREVYELRESFSRLYFDNADLTDNEELIEADKSKFYFIGQTDDGEFYRDMGALYKACKKSGADFQYRVRNGMTDKKTDILSGIETIKPYIIY